MDRGGKFVCGRIPPGGSFPLILSVKSLSLALPDATQIISLTLNRAARRRDIFASGDHTRSNVRSESPQVFFGRAFDDNLVHCSLLRQIGENLS